MALESEETPLVRPTHVEVDLGCLARNLKVIREGSNGAGVMPILKANAYGHGLLPVARHLVEVGVEMLGVAFLEEGIELRQAGITAPILVLGGIAGEQIPLFLQHDLTLTAPSVEKLRLIEEAAASMGVQARVHLKIDTGMERLGVHWYSADALLRETLKCPHVEVEGIYSHFANADAADLGDARRQLDRFHEVLGFYERHSLPLPLRHMANSAAILQLPESHLDLVRPGIMLYGVYPSPECERRLTVEPALTWKSRVAFFKVVKAGHAVSYGSTWKSDHDVRMATVPVGYGDGYFRALSNQSRMLIRGVAHPVVGRICMDQTLVNLEQGTAYNGDEVVLLGRQGGQMITADELAEQVGTIPYEILTNINTRVPRVHVGS